MVEKCGWKVSALGRDSAAKEQERLETWGMGDGEAANAGKTNLGAFQPTGEQRSSGCA